VLISEKLKSARTKMADAPRMEHSILLGMLQFLQGKDRPQ
jgi:hypothetical protein